MLILLHIATTPPILTDNNCQTRLWLMESCDHFEATSHAQALKYVSEVLLVSKQHP